MDDTNPQLLELTADIVAAHLGHNKVSLNDVADLIAQVHTALTSLGAVVAPAVTKREPFVSPRAAIKPDSLSCLVCGQKAKMLKRHLRTAHNLTPEQYRNEFGLRSDYPMVAPDYAEARRGLALKIGLGRKPSINRGSKAQSGKSDTTPAQTSGPGRRKRV